MAASYEVIEEIGDRIVRVRYTGIGTTGIRNRITDQPINREIRSAVQPDEFGPPAYESPNPAGFGSVYVDLSSNRYISESEYESRRRRKGQRFYRTIWSGDKDYSPTNTYIEVITFMTRHDPHGEDDDTGPPGVREVREKWNTAVTIVSDDEQFYDATPGVPKAREESREVDDQIATHPLGEIRGQCLIKNNYGRYHYEISFGARDLDPIEMGDYLL